MAESMADRRREAREYVGLTVEDAARKLRCSSQLIEDVEGGSVHPGDLLYRLGRLYHRPPSWFRGEFRFEPDTATLQAGERLSSHDREAILDFAEFLQCSAEVNRD